MYVANRRLLRDLAPAGDSAARPGSCRKPPSALYVGCGKEWVTSLSVPFSSAVDGPPRHPGQSRPDSAEPGTPACSLVLDMPHTFGLLAAREVSGWAVRLVTGETSHLDRPTRRRVDTELAGPIMADTLVERSPDRPPPPRSPPTCRPWCQWSRCWTRATRHPPRSPTSARCPPHSSATSSSTPPQRRAWRRLFTSPPAGRGRHRPGPAPLHRAHRGPGPGPRPALPRPLLHRSHPPPRPHPPPHRRRPHHPHQRPRGVRTRQPRPRDARLDHPPTGYQYTSAPPRPP